MGASRSAAWGAFATLALLSRLALADGGGSGGRAPVRLEFDAPPGCPDAADFARRVAERAPHLVRATETAGARVFRGSIRTGASGVVGRLVLVEPDGRTSERTLDAVDCRQATDALALITALAVEQSAESSSSDSAAPHPAPAASGAGGSATSPTATVPAPAATAAPSAASAAPSPPTTPPVPPPTAPATTSGPPPSPRAPATPPPATPPRKPAASWSVDAFAGALGVLGGAPGPTVGGGALVGVRAEHVRFVGSPSIRVGVAATLDRSFDRDSGTATFGWYAGLGEVCPVGIAAGADGRVAACLAGEYGRLVARGSGTPDHRDLQRPWAAAGLAVHYAVRVAGPLRVEVGAEALATLVRARFFLGNDDVFDVPPVCGRLFLGVGF